MESHSSRVDLQNRTRCTLDHTALGLIYKQNQLLIIAHSSRVDLQNQTRCTLDHTALGLIYKHNQLHMKSHSSRADLQTEPDAHDVVQPLGTTYK